MSDEKTQSLKWKHTPTPSDRDFERLLRINKDSLEKELFKKAYYRLRDLTFGLIIEKVTLSRHKGTPEYLIIHQSECVVSFLRALYQLLHVFEYKLITSEKLFEFTNTLIETKDHEQLDSWTRFNKPFNILDRIVDDQAPLPPRVIGGWYRYVRKLIGVNNVPNPRKFPDPKPKKVLTAGYIYPNFGAYRAFPISLIINYHL